MHAGRQAHTHARRRGAGEAPESSLLEGTSDPVCKGLQGETGPGVGF